MCITKAVNLSQNIIIHIVIYILICIVVRREIGSGPKLIKETMEKGYTLIKDGTEELQKKMAEVEAIIKEGEEAIRQLQEYIGEVALEKSQFTEGFLREFREAKQELRSARQTLFSLAEKTKAKGNRIGIMIDNWDGQSKEVLKRSLREFSKLLSISLTKLDEAKTTYNKAIDKFEGSDIEGRKFEDHLKQMLETKSAEHKAWVAKQRGVAYGAAAGTTVGMIIADVFGCVGYCSGIITTSVWATTATSVELTIESYKQNIENLEEITGNFIESLADLTSLTDGAIEFLEEEVLIIISWEANAQESEEIIDEFTEEELEEYNGYQSEIRSSLTGLMGAVEKFLNQPRYIFNN